jgi:hypothetical protein
MFWKKEPTETKRPLNLDRTKRAIVRVGSGRGFIVGDHRKNGDGFIWRDIVTAASCLPRFPSFNPFRGELKLHTYENILGRLDEKPSITADCRFADPVSNLAVLASSSEAYHKFIHWDVALQIAPPRKSYGPAGSGTHEQVWLLMLDGNWIQCVAETFNHNYMTILEEPDLFEGAMSGTPVINEDGEAIGMISAPLKNRDGNDWFYANPVLDYRLPHGALGPNSGV